MATEILRPNGAGSETAISGSTGATHWEVVDESSVNDADYVTDNGTAGTYHRDLYAFPDSAVGAGTINSVTLYCRIAREVNGFGTQSMSLRTEGTTYDYDTTSLPNGAFSTENTGALTVNPNTGAAWTWTQINEIEAGPRIRGWVDAGDPKASWVYIEVDYTSGGGPTLLPLMGVG